MPDKLLRMQRAGDQPVTPRRPVMLAIAGDSAAGKTTLTKGLVRALGAERITAVCVDDYHRYDRAERANLPFTALHPDSNYVTIMEQHLQLLATGEPILKPVYDHSTGQLIRPVLVEPREFVIVEGLLPLSTKLARACFDFSVYLNPPEDVRRSWKVARDTAKRRYTQEQVLAELVRRESDSAAFIRPQLADADIVVRFASIPGRSDPPGTPLSAELLLRPTIRHPDFSAILTEPTGPMHIKLTRDDDGRPVDALHIHGYAPREESQLLEKTIWSRLGMDTDLPESLGRLDGDSPSHPLAIIQLILLFHLLGGTR